MKTPNLFALLCQTCGLSHREAATFLDVRLDTVKSWSVGRNPAPEGVIDSLVTLADQIDAAADAVIELLTDKAKQFGLPDAPVELGIAADDHEAQSIGWPCVGAQRMALALAVARGMAEGFDFQIVPRGATELTAAAIETHEQG